MEQGINHSIEKLAELFSDYRQGELATPTSDHVEKWISQFPEEFRRTILEEMFNIFSNTYASRSQLHDFLGKLIENRKLTQDQPKEFWGNVRILNVQQQGTSQAAMINELKEILDKRSNFTTAPEDSSTDTFIYLDDFIFTGRRLKTDLSEWIRSQAPDKAVVHLIFIGWHKFGQYAVNKDLNDLAQSAGKHMKFEWWRIPELEIENRLKYRNSSDVLWPSELLSVPIVQDYAEAIKKSGGTIHLRSSGLNRNHRFYSSEGNRKILEEQFLIAGLKIRSFCREPSEVMRPLGFSPFKGFGFGAMVATYRNCPNNCPLAIWWGDPLQSPDHPFSKWYPLLQRRPYEDNISSNNFFLGSNMFSLP